MRRHPRMAFLHVGAPAIFVAGALWKAGGKTSQRHRCGALTTGNFSRNAETPDPVIAEAATCRIPAAPRGRFFNGLRPPPALRTDPDEDVQESIRYVVSGQGEWKSTREI
jgi:hypothetical protein